MQNQHPSTTQDSLQESTNQYLDAALAYASRGWPVFPIKPGGKEPLSPHGFKDSTTDVEQIKAWWAQYPEANIGIPTGQRSGFIVLDVDSYKGGEDSLSELEKQNGKLPQTVGIKTGGGGRDKLFKYPGCRIPNSVEKIATGIDIRGDGGYIVAPPSIHPSGNRYEWELASHPTDVAVAEAPAWLHEKILKRSFKEPSKSKGGQTDTESYPSFEIDWSGKIPTNTWNNFFFKLAIAARRSGLDEASTLQKCLALRDREKDLRKWPEFEDAEIERTVQSAFSQDYHVSLRDKDIASFIRDKEKATVRRSASLKKETEPLYTANFEGLVDLVEKDKKVLFLLSDETLKEEVVIEETKKYLPPPRNGILWLLPRADEVLKYVAQDNESSLYDDLVNVVKSVSILPSEEHCHLLAAWIIHTYLLEHENYSPILLFDAVPDRGKTRTGKFLTFTAFRGMRVSEMREANIIRYSRDLKATLFFDLKDAYRAAEKNNCLDLMLNRFEKGAVVSRVLNPDKGPFNDMTHFEVFGPTIIATNEGIEDVLESRGISIVMPEVDDSELARFNFDVVPELFLPFRERLTALRLRRLKNPFPEVEKPSNKRLGDIMRPIFRIVRGVKPEAEDCLKKLVKDSESERVLTKASTDEGHILSCFIDIAESSGIKHDDSISVEVVRTKVNETRSSFADQISANKIGRCLKKVGFKRARGTDNKAAYKWDCALASRLKRSWGLDREKSPNSSLIPQLIRTPSIFGGSLGMAISPNSPP